MASVWGKMRRPAPELLEPRDDIDEARAIREEAITDMIDIRMQAPFVRKITNVMIDRQGRNHYIETLYEHLPKGAA